MENILQLSDLCYCTNHGNFDDEVFTLTKNIRLLAQYYDTTTNEVLEEAIIEDESILKAEALRDLGYDHKNQVDYLQKIQDFKLKHQLKLSLPTECPKCQEQLKKQGISHYKFHAALTDH